MSFKLDETSPIAPQPEGLTVRLYRHQRASIYAMLEFEKNGGVEIIYPETTSPLVQTLCRRSDLNFKEINEVIDNQYFLHTTTGILGDKAGSGKTYMLIGLITSQLVPKTHRRMISGDKHFSLTMKQKEPLSTNLVVLPHSLIRQWDQSLQNTDLKYLIIDTINNIEDFCDIEYGNTMFENTSNTLHTARVMKGVKRNQAVYVRYLISATKAATISEYDIVVLNVNCYKHFKRVFRNVNWARVIIDEMDTISLPTDFSEYGSFNWFITATPNAVFTRHKRYVSSIFGNLQWIIDYFQIRCDENFIVSSMGVPEVYTYFIRCLGNQLANTLCDVIPPNVMEMINAGNMREAVQHLNSNIETQDSIKNVVKRNMDRELHNLRLNLQHHMDYHYSDQRMKEERTKTLQEAITRMEDKIEGVLARLSNLEEKDCCVCFDACNIPTLCNKCQNSFCLQCLMLSLRATGNTCPMCKALLSQKDYTVIDSNTKKQEEELEEIEELFSQVKKDEVLVRLLDFILDQKDSRIIICSNQSSTFVRVKERVASLGVAIEIVSGSSGRVSNILTDFRKGDIRILFMDASHYASGLNIECTTHMIMYNRFNKELETQMIGRGHRMGRTDNLRVIYLTTETESQEIIVGKRKFEINTPSDLGKIVDPQIKLNLCALLPANFFATQDRPGEDEWVEPRMVIRYNWFGRRMVSTNKKKLKK
jgi:hypothetical protein